MLQWPRTSAPWRVAMIALRSSTMLMMGMPGHGWSAGTTSTTAKPRSTGLVAQSTSGKPGRVGAAECRREQREGVGRREERHRARGTGHVVGDELQDGPPGFDLHERRGGGHGHRLQIAGSAAPARARDRSRSSRSGPRESRVGSAWGGHRLRGRPLWRRDPPGRYRHWRAPALRTARWHSPSRGRR